MTDPNLRPNLQRLARMAAADEVLDAATGPHSCIGRLLGCLLAVLMLLILGGVAGLLYWAGKSVPEQLSGPVEMTVVIGAVIALLGAIAAVGILHNRLRRALWRWLAARTRPRGPA